MTTRNNPIHSLQKHPLFLLFSALFTGILFSRFFFFRIESLIVFLLFFSTMIIWLQLINLLKKRSLMLVLFLLFFLAGMIIYKPFYDLKEGACTITGQINKVSDSSIRLTDVSFLEKGVWYKASGEFYCFLPENEVVDELDYIALNGTNNKSGNLNFVRVFMASDFFSYPYSEDFMTSIIKHFNNFAKGYVNFIKKNLGETNGSYASGIFLGLGMDRQIRDVINRSGISYLFVVSGFHFFLTFFIFSYALSFFKIKSKFAIFLKILFLILFYMICATGPSSFRAFLMLFLYQLFKLFDYPVSSLNVIGLSGLIILLNDPAIALNAGFQMTFGAVIGILLLNKLLKNKNKILRKFTPLGSLLFIIPITAFHFKRIPLLSVPIGLILSITLIPLIMICMLISLLFYAIQLQFLATFLLKGLNPLLNLARGITDFLSKNLGTISVEGLARNCLILSIPIVSLFLIMQIAGKKKCTE